MLLNDIYDRGDISREFLKIFKPNENKKQLIRTSLVVQWLRLHASMQGVRVQCLVSEPRSHMLLEVAKKQTKKTQNTTYQNL